MAIAHVANRGTNTSKSSGATLTVQPSANIVAGRLARLYTVWDNTDTADGETTRLSCADNVGGNTWTKVAEYTNTEAGAAADGATVAIFQCVVTNTIATTATITITSNTSRVAKCLSLHEFTIDEATVATEDYEPGGGGGGGSFNFSLAGMTSRAYLLDYVFSFERGDHASLGFTQDADYTSISFASTAGGAANSNQSLFGGFRLATLTGDTVGVSVGSAAGEHAWILAATYEVASGGEEETPTPGGGVAGGNAPSAAITTPVGGAPAAGQEPGASSSATIGGAAGAGAEPSASASATVGGADAAGTAATVTVTVTPGGAAGAGVAPSDGAGVEETPTPGGAVAQGASPAATTTTTPGGAAAAGFAASAGVTVTVGGAVALGTSATATVALAAGGAEAGGQITDPLAVANVTFFDSPTPTSVGFSGIPGAGFFDSPSPTKVNT